MRLRCLVWLSHSSPLSSKVGSPWCLYINSPLVTKQSHDKSIQMWSSSMWTEVFVCWGRPSGPSQTDSFWNTVRFLLITLEEVMYIMGRLWLWRNNAGRASELTGWLNKLNLTVVSVFNACSFLKTVLVFWSMAHSETLLPLVPSVLFTISTLFIIMELQFRLCHQ